MSLEISTLVAALMQSRHTILPKRLLAPGPDAAQQALILEAAATAPDHGQILPWRFVVVEQDARALLAEVFANALLERDPDALPAQLEQAREKAFRAPWLLLAIVDGQRGDASVDIFERMVSAGCAIQNMLLMATALGFGSALTSGKALNSRVLRELFALHEAEQALCFVSVGTAVTRKSERVRPHPRDYVTQLRASGLAPTDE